MQQGCQTPKMEKQHIGCVFIWIDHNGSIVFAAQVYCPEQLMTSLLDEPV
jgi:hypothetical protein